jgi:hypothetical protein
MHDEILTDHERRRLLTLVMQAMPNGRDPELLSIAAKIIGVDTVLVARRAYPSFQSFPEVIGALEQGGKR